MRNADKRLIHKAYYYALELTLHFEAEERKRISKTDDPTQKERALERLHKNLSIYLLENLYVKLEYDIHHISIKKKRTSYELELLLLGISECIKSRKVTAIIAEYYLKNLILTFSLIQEWLAKEKGIPSHLRFMLRQKSIEADLTKILSKVICPSNPEVKDRFGFTCIVKDDHIEKIYFFAEIFTGICTGINHEYQEEFMKWLVTNTKISDVDKFKVQKIIKCHLKLKNAGNLHGNTEDFDPEKYPNIIRKLIDYFFKYGFKDYIFNPKENSYQSLQGIYELSVNLWDIVQEILALDMRDSHILELEVLFTRMLNDGFKNLFPELTGDTLEMLSNMFSSMHSSLFIEGQFKNQQMFDNPYASHESHKKNTSEKLQDVFSLNSKEVAKLKKTARSLGITFSAYDSILTDKCGLHNALFFDPVERICMT